MRIQEIHCLSTIVRSGIRSLMVQDSHSSPTDRNKGPEHTELPVVLVWSNCWQTKLNHLFQGVTFSSRTVNFKYVLNKYTVFYSSPLCVWIHNVLQLLEWNYQKVRLFREADLKVRCISFLWHELDPCYILLRSLDKTLELCCILHKGLVLFRVRLSPAGKTNRNNKLMWHWWNS